MHIYYLSFCLEETFPCVVSEDTRTIYIIGNVDAKLPILPGNDQ